VGEGNAGQSWPETVSDHFEVVDADDRQVSGDAQTVTGGCLIDAEGLVVVVAEDRRWSSRQFQQLPCADSSVGTVRLDGHELRIELDARGCQTLPIALESADRSRMVFGGLDEPDASVPGIRQLLDRRAGRRDLIRRYL
jgi:hypothetical protein